MMMEMSGIIYLVRHCATSNDASNYPMLLGQKSYIGLSTPGRVHATALGNYFASKRVTEIYSSPSMRAVQTARILADITHADITFCSSLLEADMGEWEGQVAADVAADYPDEWAAHLRDPSSHGYLGGENLGDVCRRALGLIDAIATKHCNDRVVVVAHKYVNRAVLAHLMGVPMVRVREIDQDPGCINVIRVFRGVMELQAVNHTSNLDLLEEDEQCNSRLNTSVL